MSYGSIEISDVVDHIDIYVEELESAVEWYTKKLGFSIQALDLHDQTPTCYHLVKGNLGIDLLQCHEGQQPGIDHVAFRVEDVFKTAEVLKSRGIEFLHEPLHQPLSGRDLLTFKAPEGVKFQLARKIRRANGEDRIINRLLKINNKAS